jgi:hypothetical protein
MQTLRQLPPLPEDVLGLLEYDVSELIRFKQGIVHGGVGMVIDRGIRPLCDYPRSQLHPGPPVQTVSGSFPGAIAPGPTDLPAQMTTTNCRPGSQREAHRGV